jgi:hypothetical protein
VSELERLRAAFADAPGPDASAVEAGRELLLREVGRHPTPRRRPLSVLLAAVVVAAIVVAALASEQRGGELTGVQIASAAGEALVSSPPGIWHIVEVVSNGSEPPYRVEKWESTRRPYVIHITTRRPGVAATDEVETSCGGVYATEGTVTVDVRPRAIASWIENPKQLYRSALRSKHLRYLGKVSVGDIDAYKLVVREPFRGSPTYQVGGTTTILVRVGSYLPLASISVYTRRIFERGAWHSSVTRESVSYPTVEWLPRNRDTERLLRLTPLRDSFVIPIRNPRASAACTRTVTRLLPSR